MKEVLLFFVLLIIAVTNGQTCENFNIAQVPSSGPYCSPFVSPNVYINNNHTLTSVDLNVSQDPLFRFTIQAMSVLPLECYKQLMSIVCQSYFPPCPPSSSSLCLSMCESGLSMCQSSWAKLNITDPLNCDESIPSGRAWPTRNCNANVFPPLAASSFSPPDGMRDCPSVYALRHHPTEQESFCTMRCPDPSYSEDEWKRAGQGAMVATITSFVLQVFLIASYLIDPRRRAFPARVQLYMCISVLGFTIGSLIQGMNPTKTVMCVDSTTYSNQENNSRCATQAFFLTYFGFCAVMWVLTISFVIYITVVHEIRPSRIQYTEKYMHMLGWGLSGVFAIASGTTKSYDIGFTTRTHCFLKIDLNRSISVDYPLFYIPVTILLVFILYCLGAAIIKLARYKALFKDAPVGKDGTVKAQRRLLIVVAICLVIFGTFFGSRYSTTKEVAIKYTHDRDAWVNCKVRAEIFGYDYPPECDLYYNPLRRPYGNVVFSGLVGCLGFWLFILFGTDKRIFVQWKILILCLFKGDTSAIYNYIKFGFDYYSSADQKPHTNTNDSAGRSRTSTPTPVSLSLTQTVDSNI